MAEVEFQPWTERTCTGEPTAHALTRYRCFLPDLAGLAGLRRVGPGTFSIIALRVLADSSVPRILGKERDFGKARAGVN